MKKNDQLLLLDVDPQARHEHDFYQTFRWQVGALYRRLNSNLVTPSTNILEPCAGELAIAGFLREQGLSVWTNDIIKRERPLNFQLDATRSRSWDAFDRKIAADSGDARVGVGVDLSITNVPFKEAMSIVAIAYERSRLGVITLLRSTWDEPTEDRQDWLKAHEDVPQIAMPRADYRGTGSSESASHYWFLFLKNPAVATFRIKSTVTREERDELIRIYGGGH